MTTLDIQSMDFQKMNGLIPAVIQDSSTLQILMLGFMNREALEKTVTDGKVTFYSRTRDKLWQKGETSGNKLSVVSITPDCDRDTVLILARPAGPTCHTGAASCFEIEDEPAPASFLQTLYDTIKDRNEKRPAGSYTTSLLEKGQRQILEKIAEESEEVLLAAESQTRERLVEESSDLLYHLLVLLVSKGISLQEISNELKRRKNERRDAIHRVSGNKQRKQT